MDGIHQIIFQKENEKTNNKILKKESKVISSIDKDDLIDIKNIEDNVKYDIELCDANISKNQGHLYENIGNLIKINVFEKNDKECNGIAR